MVRFLLYWVFGFVLRKRTMARRSAASQSETMFDDEEMTKLVSEGKLCARVFFSSQTIQIAVYVESVRTVFKQPIERVPIVAVANSDSLALCYPLRIHTAIRGVLVSY